jgi:hypothetical protein
MLKQYCWLVFFVLAASTAHAADRNGKFAVKGPGIGSCERFVKAKEAKAQEYFLFGGWLDGYLTAQNQARKDTFDVVSWENTDVLAAYLEAFCRKNPDALFYRAVEAMVEALLPRRIKSESDLVKIEHGGQRTALYRETLRRVQRHLKDQGFYKGTVDGLYGPGTRKAILGFQRQEGIAESGIPDPLTLYHMLTRPLGRPHGARAK